MRSNTRPVVLLSVVAMLAAGSPARAADTWFLAEHDAVAVMSQDSSAAARVLAALTMAQVVMRQAAAVESSPNVRGFAVKNAAALRELLPQFWERRGVRPHGGSFLGPHSGFMAIRTDVPIAQQFPLLLHEYTHLLTADLVPGAPAWLNEGLSEFWGALVLNKQELVIGRPPAQHLKLLRTRKWLPPAEMAQQRVELATDQARVAMFYAQSWAMVHYLLLGRDSSSPLTFAPSERQWSPQLEATLRHYVTEGNVREVTLSLRPFAIVPHEARPISAARALAEQANMVLFGERPDAALPMVRRALTLDAREPLALEVMGTHYFLRNQMDPAREWLARALDADPARYSAAVYLALLSASSADRERYLTAAVKAKPDLALAWQRLWTLHEKEGRTAPARAWCDRLSPLLRQWLWLDQRVLCRM